MAIQYIDRLKRWELSPWLWLTIRLGLLNFLLIAIGFMAGASGTAGGMGFVVLSKVYLVILVAWMMSIGGLFTARCRHQRQRML